MVTIDYIAITYFIFCWFGFSVLLKYGLFPNRTSLSDSMDEHRAAWFRAASDRDLRMIDTGIVAGLQNGVGFFASATILAIGGCIAAIGAAEQVTSVFADIPIATDVDILVIEYKLAGLIALLGYSFFKFGWAYRLFNYCGILLGAMPLCKDEKTERLSASYAEKAGEMNILAGRHFTAGMRGIFLAVGYLGWFVGSDIFIITTTLVMLVLMRRQYFSQARNVASGAHKND